MKVTPINAALLLTFALFLAGQQLAGSQLAYAQARDAQQMIDAGVAARRGGDDERALVLFTQAWEAGHAPRARAQMGLAEQALGKYVESRLHLVEALAATRDAWITGRRAALEEALAAVQARLGQLDVRSEQPGARLRINGRDAGALPRTTPLWVMPGTVAVEVSAPGFASSARTIAVTAGQLSRERFELIATPSASMGDSQAPPTEETRLSPMPIAPEHADQAAESSGSALPTIGWITAGVGVVGVGLGVFFYALRESAVSRYNDDAKCLAGGLTREENCGSWGNNARTAETLMTVSLIGGGLLLAGGLVLALVGGGSRDTEPPPAQARVNCAPVFGAVVGAACEGRF